MQSEGVQWDLTQIHCGSGAGSMLLLFLLVVLVVVGSPRFGVLQGLLRNPCPKTGAGTLTY
jgi:hypothetical protein